MGHPSEALDVDIDEENEGHMARHGVTPTEVLQVFSEDPLWASNKKNMAATWLMLGRTHGGRPLHVPVTYDEIRQTVRPVTARTCEPEEVARWNV